MAITLEQLDDTLWHAGLLPEHRQAAEQSVDLSSVSVDQALATLRGNNPGWFAAPRITPPDAIWPLTQTDVDYERASREDRERRLWAQAGSR